MIVGRQRTFGTYRATTRVKMLIDYYTEQPTLLSDNLDIMS